MSHDSTGANAQNADVANTAGQNQSLDLPAAMFRSGEHPEETSLTMQRRIQGKVFTNAKFTTVGDLALFEGDIMLGTLAEVRAANDEGRGLGVVGAEFRWPDGVVPYVIQAESVRARVEGAIAHWQQHTPFKFVERTDEEDFISFEERDGCWSRIGRQGGEQVISLGLGCALGSAIHEIGHSLGLWHEQGRSDRDDFIEIRFENINPQFVHNFDKHVLDGDDFGAYDFGSIMHYPATAFSVNGEPTIVAKGGAPIGQRNGLSKGDIAGIRLMYPNLNWPPEAQ